MIWLLVALFTKHFIVDFPLQPKWMYSNKGTFGHPGGIVHAVLHGVMTFVILIHFISIFNAFAVALAETVAHYLIDFSKMNINKYLNWGPTTHEEFWWLLGFDQWLHAMCYCCIVAFINQ